ncbi:translation initiation factor 2 [Streptomyces sp. AJS327]|nr:translation initiation factor 2 [Streptomyces sp. AJS327]
MLDVLPALSGDDRLTRLFTLVPGSDFGPGVLSAIDRVGGRVIPWSEACARTHDLVVAASPKGELSLLRGPHVLLPHGAGYNKSIPGEGSADSASGLDPAHLLRADGDAPLGLHAVAHPDQLARLSTLGRWASGRARVVGDPTLERVLASRPLRDRYRAALGTGPRTLLVLASTWGPESLLSQRPGLPVELATRLPHDEYQVALVVHPNEHSRLGGYELNERLAPALEAGLVLAAPHEEWASLLVAADALVTDHGSTALYYCAAGDRPIVSAPHGGTELIPGSPMHTLLRRIPRLEPPETAGAAGTVAAVAEALDAYRPGPGREAAEAAFACQGDALDRLRTEVYALLGLEPPPLANPVRPLPSPTRPGRGPVAFDVHAEVAPDGVRLARRALGDTPGHHLAVEYGAASEPLTRSAGLLFLRPVNSSVSRAELAWTPEGWTEHALAACPGCRTAAAILPSGHCLLRVRGHPRPYVVRAEPRREGGRTARADPAAAASAAHAWLVAHGATPTAPVRLECHLGERAYRLVLRPVGAGPEDPSECPSPHSG